MRTIRKQMTLSLALAITIILGGFVLFTLQRLSAIPEMIEFDKQEIANARADEISRELEHAQSFIASLANSTVVRRMDIDELQEFLPSLEGTMNFRNLTVSDSEGIAWTTYDAFIDISEQEQFKAIFEDGLDVYVSRPFYSPFIPEDVPIFTVSHAVKNDFNETIGLINIVISTAFLDEVISEINYKTSGYAYIIDSQGHVVTHPSETISIDDHIRHWMPEEDYQTLLENERGLTTYDNQNGTKEVAINAPIAASPGWTFVLTLDYAEAYSEYYSTVRYLQIAAVFVLLFIIVFSFFYANAITKPLLKLTAIFKQAASGDLSVKASETSNNELGEAGKHFNQMIEQIKNLTYADAVTGLYNYNSFLIEAKQMIKQHNQRLYALAIVSIDDFKRINSLSGYEVGNALLKTIAETLANQSNMYELVGRYFGDELIVLLSASTNSTLEERVTNTFALFNQSFPLENHAFHINISLGITYIHNKKRFEDYVYEATVAKSSVKQQGGNAVAVYNQTMNYSLQQEKALEDALFEGLKKHHFTINLQAVVNAEGKTVGYESLLRFTHEDFKHYSILTVIKALEKFGYMKDVGYFVISESLKALKKLKARDEQLFIAINISALQLEQQDFIPTLVAYCKDFEINPHEVWIEITETHAMENVEQKITLLRALNKEGFKVAIDDFGTGYSSLAYFSLFPIDALKIDKRFVSTMTHDDNALSIVKTIINMAQNMHITLIAEGVETFEQRDKLLSLGCDLCQGFLYMKPKRLDEII